MEHVTPIGWAVLAALAGLLLLIVYLLYLVGSEALDRRRMRKGGH